MPTKNRDLHGNVPDESPVALLLIGVINHFEYEDGETTGAAGSWISARSSIARWPRGDGRWSSAWDPRRTTTSSSSPSIRRSSRPRSTPCSITSACGRSCSPASLAHMRKVLDVEIRAATDLDLRALVARPHDMGSRRSA
jgi:hypothetical protein